MKALLMVGGEGRRLRPLTTHNPKSLLRLGGQTILEQTLFLLRRHGITDVTLAVNYLAFQIEEYVGSGERFGIRATYVHESSPLGTAGALSLLGNFDGTLLMMNGDIITDLDVSAMMACHKSGGAVMTVASKVMHTDLSLGVLDVGEDGTVEAYREKPRISHRFGLGIYMLEPRVLEHIRPNERLDAPDLISTLLSSREKVSCYDHHGKWVDIGLPEDYDRVQQEISAEIGIAARQFA